MELTLETKDKGNFDTTLYNIIKVIPENKIYNFEHGLRTPMTIYDRARERVIKAFEELLKVIRIEKGSKFESVDWECIDSKHKELLDSLMSFVDDGFNIIKCLYPLSREVKKEKSSVEWLKKVEYKLISECSRKVYDYRKKIGLIDNKIKHEHGRYQHLEFSFSYYKVYGFYIDSVDREGVFHPNEEIHPKFNGIRTAISYNKDLRELLVNYYLIAEQFSNTISKIIYKEHEVRLNMEYYSCEEDDRIIKVVQNINLLDEAFFLDEYSELPQIQLYSEKIIFRKKAYKYYSDRLVRPNEYHVTTQNKLEDKCAIAPPYMRLKNNKNSRGVTALS